MEASEFFFIFINLKGYLNNMSAIKEFIINFTKEYQRWEDCGNGAGPMTYSGSDIGEQVKIGKDLSGLIPACRLDRIEGIDEWFGHMAKDYTATAGIPLPFAEAIQNITGIQTDEAIEWLTANGADLIENGTEEAILSFIKDNPKAYQYALVLGTVWGFIDDNPLLIAMNAFFYLRKLKKEGRLQRGLWGKVDRFARTSFNVIANVCSYTFLADLGLSVFGINLADMIGHGINFFGLGADLAATADYTFEIASSATDLVNGVTTLGMGFLASKIVKKGFERLNSDIKHELEKILPLASYKKQFNLLIDKNAPPESLMPVIEMMEQNGIYQPIL